MMVHLWVIIFEVRGTIKVIDVEILLGFDGAVWVSHSEVNQGFWPEFQ
jgi:hypothetical protein